MKIVEEVAFLKKSTNELNGVIAMHCGNKKYDQKQDIACTGLHAKIKKPMFFGLRDITV